jgi:uncharacterized membrane protein
MENTRNFTDKLFLVLKGLAMGAANKVPGVSGGVVAFVAGFYEEFLYSLKRVNRNAFKLLFKGRFKSCFTYINGRFLSLLFLGMLISFFSVSKLLDYLILHYELYVWSVFFGMIIGSIYYMSKAFNEWSATTVTAIIISTILGLSVSFLSPARENDHLLFVFFCGIISVSGMTLPGFSGSFILILLGNYVLLLVDAVNALYDTFANLITGQFHLIIAPERVRMLKILAVFTIGSVTGLVTFSHALSYIIKHYKNVTIASIIGFIAGSLGVVWPWKKTIFKYQDNGSLLLDSTGEKIIQNYQRYIPELHLETLYALGFIILGFSIVLGLELYGKKQKQHA